MIAVSFFVSTLWAESLRKTQQEGSPTTTTIRTRIKCSRQPIEINKEENSVTLNYQSF